MAKEEPINEPKVVINGGNIYQNVTEVLENRPLSHSIHEVYFGAYQNLINQIGTHSNLELAIHIRVSKEFIPETNKEMLRCKIETIPIVEEQYKYYIANEPKVIEPYIKQRKCTFKERLKILFKGEL